MKTSLGLIEKLDRAFWQSGKSGLECGIFDPVAYQANVENL